jgi:hypothetical protein
MGAVRGRLTAATDTPVSSSCALAYWSVRREMTTVGSLYSRKTTSSCARGCAQGIQGSE